MAGVYLHIPFCKQACHYCDFYFSTDVGQSDELCLALEKEMVLQQKYLAGHSVETLYLGGGTPSLLKADQLNRLLESVHGHFDVVHGAEITLEANPDDLNGEKLRELKRAGVNRLSIGIQSFDDNLLKFLNRPHNASDAERCIATAREAGFDNISIDLMYAIPGLSSETWKNTLHHALLLSSEHISLYSLTIEERTVFGNWNRRGKLQAMPEETAADQFEILMDVLETAGYEHYEISNFCKPGFHSRHNSNYWKRQHYLGLGPSAHSYNGTSRQFNVRNNAHYLRSLKSAIVPFEREELSPENKINEYILTTLRTNWGCSLAVLEGELNDHLAHRKQAYLERLQADELLVIKEGVLVLTRKGRLLADKIAEDLMVDA